MKRVRNDWWLIVILEIRDQQGNGGVKGQGKVNIEQPLEYSLWNAEKDAKLTIWTWKSNLVYFNDSL